MFESSVLQGVNENHNKLKIIDAVHVRPRKIGNKWTDEVLYIIYRDTVSGEKKLATILKPEVDIWFVKPEFRDPWKRQRSYLPETKCYKCTVPYNRRRSRVLEELKEHDPNGRLIRILKAAYANGETKALDEVYKWRYAMYSNFKLEDHTIMMWNLEMKPDFTPLAKAYLDIESDLMRKFGRKYHQMTNEESKAGEAPINACTIIFDHKENSVLEKEYTVHTFLLRNHDQYPQQAEFETQLKDFNKACHKEFEEDYHKAEYKLNFYDTEQAMIAAIFWILHLYKSDIILTWNLDYEVPQFSQRIQHLGFQPEQFFSHSDFKKGLSFNYWNSDNNPFHKSSGGSDDKAKKFNNLANRTIYLNDTSYTKWSDQMVNYAAFRKGGSDYGGDGLDNVSYIELGQKKREFEGRNVNVLNAAIHEYWNFVLYNINDVWLQVGIDEKTSDTDKVYGISMNSSMSMNKVHKTTHLLINNITRNLFRYDELEKGAPKFIIGNNLNGY